MGSSILLVLMPQATLLRREGGLARARGARCPLREKKNRDLRLKLQVFKPDSRRHMGAYTYMLSFRGLESPICLRGKN